MLAAFDDDYRGIGRFAASCLFASKLLACCIAKEASANTSPTSLSNFDDPSR
jgi:hypothetical protein